MSSTADVVVIGGGVMGTSTAFRLAERGLKVTLVEKGFLGSGTSGKSSAVVRQHYSNETTARMALHGLRVFQNFPELVGGECGFVPVGCVMMAAAKDRDALEATVALMRRVGIRVNVLSPEELREIAPGIAEAGAVVGAYEPEGGYADPALTVNAFGHAARRHGATILQDTEVTGLIVDGGRARGVVTRRGEIAAGAVVNTTGPWAPRVARMLGLGIELPIHPCRVQLALFAPPPDGRPAPLVFGDFPNVSYFRPETGGMTLIGSLDPIEATFHADPDDYNERIDTDVVIDLGTRLSRRFPVMERAESRGGYAGIYDITPDWHPVIDEVPPGSGFFVCAGSSGHGFKLAPAIGEMLADLVTGQRTEGLDASPFRFRRYAEGRPVTGQYEYSIIG